MKKEKGITLVSLVVTIIILIILAGVSINMTLGEEGIITIAKKAKENMELAQIEEQTKLNELYMQIEQENGDLGDINIGCLEKINEFKRKIAEYIEEAGGIKPEPPETVGIETFRESILGIVKEVTKDATATADNITEGKTAWVNGEKIVGTGKDNQKFYEDGKNSVIKVIYSNVATIFNTQWNNSSKLQETATSPTGYGSTSKTVTGRSNNIYIGKTPDEREGYLVSFDLNYSCSVTGGGSVENSKVTFELCDENNSVITRWEDTLTKSKSIQVTKSLLDYRINGNYVYIKYNAKLIANGFTNDITWASAIRFTLANSLKLHYITMNET